MKEAEDTFGFLKKYLQTFPFTPVSKKNPEIRKNGDCGCDVCEAMSGEPGQAMLEYFRRLQGACAEAITKGADPEFVLDLDMNGPDAFDIRNAAEGMRYGRGSTHYIHMRATLSEMAGVRIPKLWTEKPDIGVVRELYEDDPVVGALCDWIEHAC